MYPLEPIVDCWNIYMEVREQNTKSQCIRLCSMLCKTSITSVTMNRRQLCAKLNIGGECLNEYSKSKLIKLYDCNDKCKTDEFTHRVGRTGRANVKGCVITLLTTIDYNKFTKIERNLKLSIKRETLDEFELKDRQPRQKQMKKKSLSERKGLKKPKRKDENSGKKRSSKTTKRDTNRVFRKI